MPITYETRFAIRQLALNAVTWTDITGAAIPINCDYVFIFNDTGQDILLRTDPGNAASQITIHDSQMFQIGAPAHGFAWLSGFGTVKTRFAAGSANPVGSLLASSSTPSATIICIL